MARREIRGRGGLGGGRDLTTGPIGSSLILFALPMMASNILQSLNGSANAVWVSHALGESALAAISNANQIFFLMMGASFGVSMAANILIAQAIGAGNRDLAKRVVGSSTLFFVVLSTAVGALGVVLAPSILSAMGTPPDARTDAIAYLRVIFLSMPFIYFFAFLMMAQRGTGDSRTPFYFSALAVVLDIALNPLLIMGLGPFPRLGIAGSATSTLVANALALTVMMVHLYRSGSILVLRPSEFRLLIPDLKIIRTLILKGLPMALQMMVISLASVTVMSMVNAYGSHTSAAYGAALQVWTYVQMPAMALGASVSSMAAQNIGAGRMDRVERITRIGILYSIALTGGPILLIHFLDPWILGALLPGGSPSLAIAVHINSIVIWGFVPFGVAFVYSGVVRATGVVWAPLLAMGISLWAVRVPIAHWLTPYLGADAIWLSFPLGSLTLCVLAGAYYRWGNWRAAKMLDGVGAETADTGLGTPIAEPPLRPVPSGPNGPAS